ncbi:MAG: hypothetical protein RL215_2572 [Planctomycetota bacterium]
MVLLQFESEGWVVGDDVDADDVYGIFDLDGVIFESGVCVVNTVSIDAKD